MKQEHETELADKMGLQKYNCEAEFDKFKTILL